MDERLLVAQYFDVEQFVVGFVLVAVGPVQKHPRLGGIVVGQRINLGQ